MPSAPKLPNPSRARRARPLVVVVAILIVGACLLITAFALVSMLLLMI